jgi:hypothetical protein
VQNIGKLAAVFVFAASAAQAATISYTDALTGGYSADDGVSLTGTTQGFNSSLGTLTGVSFQVTGTGVDVQTGNGNSTDFKATENNSVDVIGAGFSSLVALASHTAPATTNSATDNFAIDFVLSTTSDLQAYISQAAMSTSYAFGDTIYNGSNLVGYNSDAGRINAKVTETFTYAAAVPEPAALALFGTMLASLAFVRRRSRFL